MKKGLTVTRVLIGVFVAVGIFVVAWYAKIIQIPNLPPPGCRYQKVQCIQAPCNPILVCGDLMLKTGIRLQTPPPASAPTPKDKQSTGNCKITGCSGQICSDREVVTTCEFLPQYTCYKKATCEKQPDGKCGWTQTEELNKCLVKFQSK